MDKEKIKKRANKILGENSVLTLKNEEKIILTLQKIINEEIEDTEMAENTLNDIEKYLEEKQKRISNEEDYKFLKELSENLREQKIRRDDDVLLKNPLFKITTEDEEYYFLTRKNAHQFIEANKSRIKNSEVIKIQENENLELEKLIDIIKRNF